MFNIKTLLPHKIKRHYEKITIVLLYSEMSKVNKNYRNDPQTFVRYFNLPIFH
jgi:hypothetical protein